MKALIRNNNEVILEKYPTFYINWENGEPLTNKNWAGGPYTLIENYIPTDNLKPIITTFNNTKNENMETQNTELTQEEIEKQKKIQALEKALETLKNS